MVSVTKREMSSQAKAAAIIRKNLKTAFPYTKFSVKSESFAGGDAVHIDWTDGPNTKQVEAISDRHQYGSFDGMQDLYESTNRRDDIPQSKYVQTQRGTSHAAYADAVAILNKRFGWQMVVHEEWNQIIDGDEYIGNGWASHEIHRTLYPMTLTCGYCKHGTMPSDKYCPDCGESLDATPAIAAAEMILAPR